MRYVDLIDLIQKERVKRLAEIKRIYNLYYPY